MHKFLSTVLLWCLLSIAPLKLMGGADFAAVYPPSVQSLVGSEVFSGDQHGDFSGDYVAVLSDGSAWKVHPKSRGEYMQWLTGERVSVRLRRSFYFFKREHKFYLYNHERGQTVDVMLVRHAHWPQPLRIVRSERVHGGTKLDSIVTSSNTYNSDGTTSTTYHTTWVPREVYYQFVQLSDGSLWLADCDQEELLPGARVYVGAQGRPGKVWDYLLITGTEREARWTWARAQN